MTPTPSEIKAALDGRRDHNTTFDILATAYRQEKDKRERVEAELSNEKEISNGLGKLMDGLIEELKKGRK